MTTDKQEQGRDLKPCPFCGGEAELYGSSDDVVGRCTKCGSTGQMAFLECGEDSDLEQINSCETKAQEHWNRRAPSGRVDGLRDIERIREFYLGFLSVDVPFAALDKARAVDLEYVQSAVGIAAAPACRDEQGEDRRDAERYRWLLRYLQGHDGVLRFSGVGVSLPEMVETRPFGCVNEDVSTAIDAAMRHDTPKKGESLARNLTAQATGPKAIASSPHGVRNAHATNQCATA